MLNIKYFGMIAEAVEKGNEQLAFQDQTVRNLIEQLKLRYPQLESKKFKLAVNQVMANEEQQLKANDEVAVLPPFSGG